MTRYEDRDGGVSLLFLALACEGVSDRTKELDYMSSNKPMCEVETMIIINVCYDDII